jgi:hypothetical protein
VDAFADATGPDYSWNEGPSGHASLPSPLASSRFPPSDSEEELLHRYCSLLQHDPCRFSHVAQTGRGGDCYAVATFAADEGMQVDMPA